MREILANQNGEIFQMNDISYDNDKKCTPIKSKDSPITDGKLLITKFVCCSNFANYQLVPAKFMLPERLLRVEPFTVFFNF